MEVLDMQLEVVRIVLKNEVNEISVCTDLKRQSGVLYTLISISDRARRSEIAGIIAVGGMFADNQDFIGAFSRGDTFNLVFLYHKENTLAYHERLYATDFPSRKKIAVGLLVALAETMANDSAAMLLLHERNINIAPDKSLYFNYFLDFADWDSSINGVMFYRKVAQTVFDTLSRDYEARHHGQVVDYPIELQVFYRKTQHKAFLSYSGIIAHVRSIPDQPTEKKRGIFRLLHRLQGAVNWLGEHSLAVFLTILILITVFYAGYAIVMRSLYRSAEEKNISYAGLETIGEVSLGDDTL